MNDINPERLASSIFRIRAFEEALDRLFEKGIINGTYHRCIGQEATAVGVVADLDVTRDYVVSNHRNHGHYLAFTKDYSGLVEELKGANEGTTRGLGGSQVLFGDHFISSGILGSTVPVATGIALGLKKRGEDGCVVCFIGDGAMGEGVIYEALNMASLWSLPICYVVEENGVAQTTDLSEITAGTIAGRFEAFSISTSVLDSSDVLEVTKVAGSLTREVRRDGPPLALIIRAPRLCAHSKGDDVRSSKFLESLKERDPASIISKQICDAAVKRQAAQAEIDSLMGF